MTMIKNVFLAIAFASLAVVSAPVAHAADPQIEAAISAGEVGERIDGYLGVVGSADPAVVRKVQEINNKRRALYEQLSKQTGTTVAQVARVTGEKQIAKAGPGQYYMDETGSWKQN
jgi:uncharacterized protein YdbL (DUF1318 family)